MKTIWKFQLPWPQKKMLVPMPVGSRVLHVAEQEPTSICLWALVDPKNAPVPREVLIVCTGESFDPDSFLGTNGAHYVGTLHCHNGEVVHVFVR
jgi:hypothetical protein